MAASDLSVTIAGLALNDNAHLVKLLPKDVAETLREPTTSALAFIRVGPAGTLLHLAAAADDVAAVQQLIGVAGIDLNAPDAAGRTPLAVAGKAAEGVLEAAGAKRANPLQLTFYPTHAAVLAGDVARLGELLASGHAAGQPDFSGITPLHLAAAAPKNGKDMAALLVAHGAKAQVKSRYGLSPLEVAALVNSDAAVREVLEETGKGEVGAEADMPKAPVALDSMTALHGNHGISPQEVAAMQAAFDFLASAHQPDKSAEVVASTGVALFEQIFEQHPALLELFPFSKAGKDQAEQLKRHAVNVLTTLGALLVLLDNYPQLAKRTTDLAVRHVKYGIVMEHYDQVLGVVASFLAAGLGAAGAWDELQASAWTKLIATIKAVAAGCYEAQPASTTSA